MILKCTLIAVLSIARASNGGIFPGNIGYIIAMLLVFAWGFLSI